MSDTNMKLKLSEVSFLLECAQKLERYERNYEIEFKLSVAKKRIELKIIKNQLQDDVRYDKAKDSVSLGQ